MPHLLIVTGPVASGKTTLSQRLAQDLQLPLLNRDSFKEIIFDTLGWSDRAWSQRVGVSSYALLYYSLEALLQTRASLIIESNFQTDYDSPKLAALCQRYGYQPLQLCCTAQRELLMRRYSQRIEQGKRHPGHGDTADNAKLLQNLWSEQPEILAIGGIHLLVDTTSQESLSYQLLLEQIQQQLG